MIWLASFPKSGNTWMRVLFSNVLAASAEPKNINELGLLGDIASSREAFDDATLVESSLLTQREIELLRPIVHDDFAASPAPVEPIVKTHDAYDILSDGTPLLGRRARAGVYVVRDPRDVAISYAHFFDCSIDDAIAHLSDASARLAVGSALHLQTRLGGWSGHVASWIEQSVLPTCVVRYEDLLADTAGTFRGVLDFIGIAATDEAVQRATRHSDLAELQRQERQHGFRERPRQAKSFFRDGRAGQWHEQLDERQITAIERAHGAMMTRLGYQTAN